MPEPEIIQLGAIGIICIFLIKEVFAYLRAKKTNGNGNGELRKEIKALRENHLGTLDIKLDTLIRFAEEQDRKNDRIVELLIQIRALLNIK